MNNKDKVNSILRQFETGAVTVMPNVSMQIYSYFKTGGYASFVLLPHSISALQELVVRLQSEGLPFKIIGETTNLLFVDDACFSLLISLKNLSRVEYDIDNNLLYADAGALVTDLSRVALKYSLSGMEGLEGIPGSLGGGIFMNAGAYGNEISDFLVDADVMDYSGRFHRYTRNDCFFSRRSSRFKIDNNLVILGARFRLRRDECSTIYDRMSLYHNKRHKYQEFMYPSLGTIFVGSVYRELAKKDMLFKVVSSLFFLFNYKLRLHRRESPDNRRWLNDFAVKRFSLQFHANPFSDKDLNTLVNRGFGSDLSIRYIKRIQELIGSDFILENEIVDRF